MIWEWVSSACMLGYTCASAAGHSNDAQCDSPRDPTYYFHQRRRSGWRHKQEKKWVQVQGFLLQSALSASGSQSTTTSIFHMRRSWCAGWGCLSVCHCCVLLFALCVCVWVGGVLFMGKLHSSVITLIYGPQLPQLTVRIEADEIKGSLVQTDGLTNTPTHICTCMNTQWWWEYFWSVFFLKQEYMASSLRRELSEVRSLEVSP